MWHTCDNNIIGEFVCRDNSKARSQNEANASVILYAMKLLDRKSDILPFAASATDKLSLRLPEEIDLVCLSERLSKVETMIPSQADTIVRHYNMISKIHQFNMFVRDKLFIPKGASKRSIFLHQCLCQLSILSSHEN